MTADVKNAGVQVDVVAISQSDQDKALLQQIATAGDGAVISADDPAALSGVFAGEADTLAKQILITVPTPADLAGTEGTLSVSIDAGGETYTDAAFVTLGKTAAPTGVKPSTDLAAAPQPAGITQPLMLGGLAAVGLGLLAVLAVALGGLGRKPESIESRIEAYTRKGARRQGTGAPAPAPQGVAAQAVGIAEKALGGNRGPRGRARRPARGRRHVPQAGRVAAAARRHRRRLGGRGLHADRRQPDLHPRRAAGRRRSCCPGSTSASGGPVVSRPSTASSPRCSS